MLPVAINSNAGAQTAAPATELTKEDWLDTMMWKRRLGPPLLLSRFVERIYFLIGPIGWKPNPGQSFARVDPPPGFITDFASVPRPFWSLLPPDGEYAYAAIIHDYLYWTQTRPRDEADTILKFAMEDLKVNPLTVETIYRAVRLGGGSAWDGNAALKRQGEKRILKSDKYPQDPTTRWEDYKKRTDVFSD